MIVGNEQVFTTAVTEPLVDDNPTVDMKDCSASPMATESGAGNSEGDYLT